MQIRELLSIHDSHSAENAHADILGDAFLMERNAIYRNIKRFALKIGARYVEADTKYLLMPFHALWEIVGSRSIPYVPNARLLRAVEEKRADALAIADLSIPESYHLHEAAHVIADHFFAGVKLKSAEERILKDIVCESFANTVDALACGLAVDEMHRFFLRHNSYMYPDGRYVALFDRMNRGAGPRFTFVYTLIAYLHANFFKEKIPAAVLKDLRARYAPDAKFTDKTRKDCDSLRKMAEKLDPLFRVQTTQMYLRLEGHQGEIYDLLDFPFMDVFAENPVFRNAVDSMAGVVIGNE